MIDACALLVFDNSATFLEQSLNACTLFARNFDFFKVHKVYSLGLVKSSAWRILGDVRCYLSLVTAGVK